MAAILVLMCGWDSILASPCTSGVAPLHALVALVAGMEHVYGCMLVELSSTGGHLGCLPFGSFPKVLLGPFLLFQFGPRRSGTGPRFPSLEDGVGPHLGLHGLSRAQPQVVL